MSKQYPRMQCAVCRRPLQRAAALLKGQPVGRVCAANAGLVQPRKAAEPLATRDTQTLDLFNL
jgi:hypothetical protein